MALTHKQMLAALPVPIPQHVILAAKPKGAVFGKVRLATACPRNFGHGAICVSGSRVCKHYLCSFTNIYRETYIRCCK